VDEIKPISGTRSRRLVIGTQGYLRTGRKFKHIEVVEQILGKPLPKGAQVHHWNENKTDNRPSNLVICPSRAYHILLHYRTKAYDACGHADWVKCTYCKKYDDPQKMHGHNNGEKGMKYYHSPLCEEGLRVSRIRWNAKKAIVLDAIGFQ